MTEKDLEPEERDLETVSAACPYCGQLIILRVNERMSDADIIKEAAAHCTCQRALYEQDILNEIAQGKSAVQTVISSISNRVGDIMIQGIEDVARERIKRITVAEEGRTYTLTKKHGAIIAKCREVQETLSSGEAVE